MSIGIVSGIKHRIVMFIGNSFHSRVEHIVDKKLGALSTREQHHMLQEAVDARAKDLLQRAEGVGLRLLTEINIRNIVEDAVRTKVSNIACEITEEKINTLFRYISEEPRK